MIGWPIYGDLLTIMIWVSLFFVIVSIITVLLHYHDHDHHHHHHHHHQNSPLKIRFYTVVLFCAAPLRLRPNTVENLRWSRNRARVRLSAAWISAKRAMGRGEWEHISGHIQVNKPVTIGHFESFWSIIHWSCKPLKDIENLMCLSMVKNPFSSTPPETPPGPLAKVKVCEWYVKLLLETLHAWNPWNIHQK